MANINHFHFTLNEMHDSQFVSFGNQKLKSIYSLMRSYCFATKVMSLQKPFALGENYSQTFEDIILIVCKVIVLLQKMMDFTKHFTLVENIQKSFEDILLSKHEGIY